MNKLVFLAIHLAALGCLFLDFSIVAVILCLAFYLIRMFAITAGFHRYFSHRSYKTSRLFQFLLAFVATMSAQKGPLWWAASHRHHHRHSDTEEDLHSPKHNGIWWAHMGWVVSEEHDQADLGLVKDLSKYPELRLLDQYHYIPPLLFLAFTFLLGYLIETQLTSWNTSMWQVVTWAGFLSTVLLYHATFCINSLAHIIGKKDFVTSDDSKNSLILALLTLGEGWHNNHHRYPGSERQGFFWWQIDISHYVLVILSKLGIVWDLRVPPKRIYQEWEQQQTLLRS